MDDQLKYSHKQSICFVLKRCEEKINVHILGENDTSKCFIAAKMFRASELAVGIVVQTHNSILVTQKAMHSACTFHLVKPSKYNKVFIWDRRRIFYVPNLTLLIKYMKRSTFESIKFDTCNLGQPKN